MTSLVRTAALLAGLVSASLSAQTASYSYAGTSCTGGRQSSAVGPVPFSVRGVPRLGTTFEVVTEGSHGYPFEVRRSTFLITGASNRSAGGVPLPFDLSTMFPGEPVCGMLRTSGEISQRLPQTAHYSDLIRVPCTVPNAASMLGIRFYQQVISVELNTFGQFYRAISLSRSGVGTIGR